MRPRTDCCEVPARLVHTRLAAPVRVDADGERVGCGRYRQPPERFLDGLQHGSIAMRPVPRPPLERFDDGARSDLVVVLAYDPVLVAYVVVRQQFHQHIVEPGGRLWQLLLPPAPRGVHAARAAVLRTRGEELELQIEYLDVLEIQSHALLPYDCAHGRGGDVPELEDVEDLVEVLPRHAEHHPLLGFRYPYLPRCEALLLERHL